MEKLQSHQEMELVTDLAETDENLMVSHNTFNNIIVLSHAVSES